MKRLVRIAVVAVAAAAVSAPAPASAASPFGRATRATRTGCVESKTVMTASGVTRGFTSCVTNEGSYVPRYVRGSGTSWATAATPYKGRVLAVADDGKATYALLDSPDGVRVIKRRRDGSHASKRVSTKIAEAGGAIVARDGKWWAVWTEQNRNNPHVMDLYQARTMGTAQSRTLVRSRAWNVSPSLVHRPGGGVYLAWRQESSFFEGDVWVGSNRGKGWSFRKRVSGGDAPSLARSGSTILLAYITKTRAACPCPVGYQRRVDGVWGGTKVFARPGVGLSPNITTSAGRVFVAWSRDVDGRLQAVAVQKGSSGWSSVTSISSADELVSSLNAYKGKALAILTKHNLGAEGYDVARRQ